jgi:hypothetical protein
VSEQPKDFTGELLATIHDPFSRRQEVALDYGFHISYGHKVNWEVANAAIIERWSKSALVWIKREAWKSHDVRVEARLAVRLEER